MAAAGADIIDVSSGQTLSGEEPVYGRLFRALFADRVRLEAGVRTMTAGNISSYERAAPVAAAVRLSIAVLGARRLTRDHRRHEDAARQRIPAPREFAADEHITRPPAIVARPRAGRR